MELFIARSLLLFALFDPRSLAAVTVRTELGAVVFSWEGDQLCCSLKQTRYADDDFCGYCGKFQKQTYVDFAAESIETTKGNCLSRSFAEALIRRTKTRRLRTQVTSASVQSAKSAPSQNCVSNNSSFFLFLFFFFLSSTPAFLILARWE